MPRHSDSKVLPFTPKQMYDLVADVERYPEFLPWCSAARITSREVQGETEIMEADLLISFKAFRERFASHVILSPAKCKIETQYLDGPFRYMHSNWQMHDDPGGSRVDFDVDFEMKSVLLQRVVGVMFNQAMQRIVRAFETRAKDLYE